MEDGEEDELKGSANASAPSLQPNPKPKRVTNEQLSKFQHMRRQFSDSYGFVNFKELQRRRLQIKSRSKKRKNTKVDATGKSQIKHLNTNDEVNEADYSRLSNSEVDFGEKSSHVQQDKTKTTFPSKKLHKLHWGLDTKEPWERKANM